MNQSEFKKLYEDEKQMYEAWASSVMNEIKDQIRARVGSEKAYSEWIKIPPTFRVKEVDSLLAKAYVRKRDKYTDPYNEITDKAGVRFVVLLTSQLELLSSVIEDSQIWNYSKDKEFDEWKAGDPRIFDYQSVHYVVRAADDTKYRDVRIAKNTPCEIQIRTLMQHAYAELAHDTIYKSNVAAEPEVHRKFAKSMALMETTDELLCGAKNALDLASDIVDKWTDMLVHESEARLNGVNFDSDYKNTYYILDILNEFIEKITFEEFKSFLDNPENGYIYEKITQRSYEQVEFRQHSILLIYFLSKRFKTTLHKDSKLDRDMLQSVYSDLGLSPLWPVH